MIGLVVIVVNKSRLTVVVFMIIPIVVTLLGIVTDLSAVHPLKP